MDNSSNGGDGSFSNNGGQRYYGKNSFQKSKSRSKKVYWNRNFHGKSRETFQEENRESFTQETPQHHVQQQPAPFPRINARTMMHSNNLLAAMNSMQCGVNSMNEMTMVPNNMPINHSSTSMPIVTGIEMTKTVNSTLTPAYVNLMEENRESFTEETPQHHVQLQPAPFPPINAMTMMPSNNSLAAMNSMQCDVNPMNEMTMAPNNIHINHSSTSMPMATGMKMTQTTNSAMNPYAYMGMSSNMIGMMGMENCQYGMMNNQLNVMADTAKEVFHLTLCVLYPPHPTDPILTRPRPPGCKTVFVGHLPENITEEIIREVFERCGEILIIRMNPKGFCHVKFTSEEFVDCALYFSGYRMKIEKDGQTYTGRIHVDYAKAVDDEYEFKCKQRAIQREARHRQRELEEFYEVPTPLPVVHYSEHEATELAYKLREEKSFQLATLVLVAWLERGECNKRNAGLFYSMIQSTNSHVRRLMSEKQKYQNELDKARLMYEKRMQCNLLKFNEIIKAFNTASLQKVQNHFTKVQRKNIELWKQQTEDIKKLYVEEVLNDRVEDEMDLSEGEEENDEGATKETSDTSGQKNELEEDFNKLKEENDVLRCQLEAAENEMILLRSDSAQVLKGKKHYNDNIGVFNRNSFAMIISETDAKLLGMVSTFLNVHPLGATTDYICSYLHQLNSTVEQCDVESLMKRYPTIYFEKLTGIGANVVKWRYLSLGTIY